VDEDQLVDLDDRVLRSQPAPQLALGPEELVISEAELGRGELHIFFVDVPQVAPDHHDLVVAEDDVNATSRPLRLLLKTIDQPQ
jgi:hypothetical protein